MLLNLYIAKNFHNLGFEFFQTCSSPCALGQKEAGEGAEWQATAQVSVKAWRGRRGTALLCPRGYLL